MPRAVQESATFQNRVYALPDTDTERDAMDWAKANVPQGWHIVSVSRYKHGGRAKDDAKYGHTVRFRRGQAKGFFR